MSAFTVCGGFSEARVEGGEVVVLFESPAGGEENHTLHRGVQSALRRCPVHKHTVLHVLSDSEPKQSMTAPDHTNEHGLPVATTTHIFSEHSTRIFKKSNAASCTFTIEHI